MGLIKRLFGIMCFIISMTISLLLFIPVIAFFGATTYLIIADSMIEFSLKFIDE